MRENDMPPKYKFFLALLGLFVFVGLAAIFVWFGNDPRPPAFWAGLCWGVFVGLHLAPVLQHGHAWWKQRRSIKPPRP